MSDLSPKAPSEVVSIDFDFSNVCSSITSSTVTVSVRRGTDNSPQDLLQGAAVIVGAVVSQRFKGGLDGVDYRIECLAQTAEKGGQTFQLTGLLSVRQQIV